MATTIWKKMRGKKNKTKILRQTCVIKKKKKIPSTLSIVNKRQNYQCINKTSWYRSSNKLTFIYN